MAVGLASAADICRSTGSGCNGSLLCCNNIQEGVCCNLNAQKNAIVWNLPANSRGQAWTNANCQGSTGTFKNANKITGRCVTFSWNVYSAKWLVGGGTKRDVEAEDENCAELNTAVYEVDGVQHKVKIPEGIKAEVVGEWIESGEWEKLGQLERTE